MNDLLNCLMSLMLPFAVIPTITFTSNKKIMGDFVNGFISKLFSVVLSTLVIAINTYFVISYVIKLNISNPAFIFFVVLIGILYLLFCFYLTTDMMLAMGSRYITCLPLVTRLFSTSTSGSNNYAIHEEDGNGSEMEQVEE